jgi:hypothetical protein
MSEAEKEITRIQEKYHISYNDARLVYNIREKCLDIVGRRNSSQALWHMKEKTSESRDRLQNTYTGIFMPPYFDRG